MPAATVDRQLQLSGSLRRAPRAGEEEAAKQATGYNPSGYSPPGAQFGAVGTSSDCDPLTPTLTVGTIVAHLRANGD